jgi:hypothetical protein
MKRRKRQKMDMPRVTCEEETRGGGGGGGREGGGEPREKGEGRKGIRKPKTEKRKNGKTEKD